jgi:hypothetical protein
MYAMLEDETGQLADAVNGGIDFGLTTQGGGIQCSPAGCNVHESFSGTVSPGGVQIKSATVTAQLTAPLTIGGQPDGSCVSAPEAFPVSGGQVSGDLSCFDAQAGPVFSAVNAESGNLWVPIIHQRWSDPWTRFSATSCGVPEFGHWS